MNSKGRIVSVEPRFAISGGEVLIRCAGMDVGGPDQFRCLIGDVPARIIGSSRERVLAIVPDGIESGSVRVVIESAGQSVASSEIVVGRKLAEEIHQVANPAVDPADDSIILTRSGTRGQSLPATLFRLDETGTLTEMSVDVLNPTGLAFDPNGRLLVTNRAEGEVIQINDDSEAVCLASDLGVATGIAFNSEGVLFVGDRNGVIFRIDPLGDPKSWAILEPSVSAYHMAFGPDGSLYVAAPGLCSHDVIYRIDEDGKSGTFYKGLGRPQGLAFDTEGNLYAAACLRGRHGLVKIEAGGGRAEIFVAGMAIVGVCFTGPGDLIVATNEAVYTLPVNIYGTL